MAGQERSKWLRDERDEEWGKNLGKDNYYADFSGRQIVGKGKEKYQEVTVHTNVHGSVCLVEEGGLAGNSNLSKAKLIMGNSTGPTEEELIGLSFEERKRRRSGPVAKEYMDTDGGIVSVFPETALSKVDCADSIPTELAGLARQVSQLQ
ncbi:hypothetical protein ACET3Z_000809 [Daucus carota]